MHVMTGCGQMQSACIMYQATTGTVQKVARDIVIVMK